MTSDTKPPYPSRLEVTPEGRKLLIVFYDNDKQNWEQAIVWAMKHYKLSKPVRTIAIPEHLKFC